jgi:histidinol-phosphate aminotransferase
MAAVAAMASLNDPEQLANGRRRNRETRSFVTAELQKLGYRHIPSHANFVMIDMKRPVLPVIDALRKRDVRVGRLFPSLPTHMRVTIGRQSEMETFLNAFRRVVSAGS